MRKFQNAKMTLFDSTNARFKIAVEAQFVRGNMEQGYHDLVYISNKFTANLNPNIYLTLAYKDDECTPLYTSYPQLFRLREALTSVKDVVADNSGFTEIDGVRTVKPGYDEPVIVSNIGKGNNWISLKLVVIKSGENGVVNYTPGVSIELSTSNGYASVLTAEEFLTVYTIINDLNLMNLQCMLSLGFLDVPLQQQVGNGGYYQPQQPVYQQPQPMYQPQYNQPQQPVYQQRQQYSRPKYNNDAAGYRAPQGGYRNVVQPQRQMTYEEQAAENAKNWLSPNPDMTPVQQKTNNSLPPRESKPILTKDAIAETPISQYDYDDSSALDAIFDEE